MMKAAVLKENQNISIENIELGELDANSCRIKIAYSGICSSDIQRGFENGAYFYPLVMGHEIAGEVVEVGKNVKNFKIKDKVGVFPLIPCLKCPSCGNKFYAQCHNYDYYGTRRNGGYSEYLDIYEWNLLKLPANVDLKDAVAIEPMAVVVHALNQANVLEQAPEKIAIIGCGFLGLIASKIISLKCPNTKLTVIDRNQFKLDILNDNIEKILLKNDEDWKIFLDKEPHFNIVLEATGNPKSFEYATNIAAAKGSVIWMGNITGDLTISKKNVSSILRKELVILGTWNSLYIPEESDDWDKALQLMSEGICPSDFVTDWISLEETPEILLKLYKHKKSVEYFPSIKTIISMGKES